VIQVRWPVSFTLARLFTVVVVLAAACADQTVSTPTSPSPGLSAVPRAVTVEDAETSGWALSSTGALASLSIDPSVFKGGQSTRGTVTLSAPAPAGGTTVTLSSDEHMATVPGSITIAQGGTSGTFSITTSVVSADLRIRITATAGTDTLTALMRLTPENGIAALSVSPSRITGGDSATGTVTLASVSPAGGTVVSLSSNVVDARVPVSVTIAAGGTSGTFTIETADVSNDREAWIGATVGRDTREVQVRLLTRRASGATGSVTIGGVVE
jgi:hypothetical protein